MAFDSKNSAFDTPLSELRFDVRLRRALIRAGFGSLREVLLASNDQLEGALERDSIYALDDLRERIERDPEGFAAAATQQRSPDEKAETARRLAENRRHQISAGGNRYRASFGSALSRAAMDATPVPDEPSRQCSLNARRRHVGR